MLHFHIRLVFSTLKLPRLSPFFYFDYLSEAEVLWKILVSSVFWWNCCVWVFRRGFRDTEACRSDSLWRIISYASVFVRVLCPYYSVPYCARICNYVNFWWFSGASVLGAWNELSCTLDAFAERMNTYSTLTLFWQYHITSFEAITPPFLFSYFRCQVRKFGFAAQYISQHFHIISTVFGSKSGVKTTCLFALWIKVRKPMCVCMVLCCSICTLNSPTPQFPAFICVY